MEWLYKGKKVDDISSEYVGFVYIITENFSGKKYVGKKLAWKPAYRKVKGKKKKYQKESDWKSYYGSSRALKEQIDLSGRDKYTREILRLCKTKGELSYYEAKEQFDRDVLLRDDYYNGIISCRINKNHVKHMWHAV